MEYAPAAHSAQTMLAVLLHAVVRPEPAGQSEQAAQGPLALPADHVLPAHAAHTVLAVALHAAVAPWPEAHSEHAAQGGRPEALKSTPAVHVLGGGSGVADALLVGVALTLDEALPELEALDETLAEGEGV